MGNCKPTEILFQTLRNATWASAASLDSSASAGGFGSCPLQPSIVSAPLLWGSEPETADRICCNNHRWAEFSGYWTSTTFPMTLPAGQSTITFYDVSSGLPLFVAPVGRSYDAFILESTQHGWPSTRTAAHAIFTAAHHFTGRTPFHTRLLAHRLRLASHHAHKASWLTCPSRARNRRLPRRGGRVGQRACASKR